MVQPLDSAQRYRWRLLLSELRRDAERASESELGLEIEALSRELDAHPTEATPELVGRLRRVAEHFGRELEPQPQPVRWLSFLRYTGPGLLMLVLVAVVIERRRRRQREVSDAALARLDGGSGADSPGA